MNFALHCATLASCAAGLPFAARRTRAWLRDFAAFVACACLVACLPIPSAGSGIAVRVCLLVALANAGTAYRATPLPASAAPIASAVTGATIGAGIAIAGAPADLATTLPCTLAAAVLARALHARAPIALQVAASWLIAIAVLALLLQWQPTTPGYLPDHLD